MSYAFVDDDGRARLVQGGFGSGKTSALIARWRRLAAEHGPGRVLYVARRASAVADVRQRMVDVLTSEGDPVSPGPLVVTTWLGFALDLVRRNGRGMGEVKLLAGPAHRRVVEELLAEELSRVSELWPSSVGVVRRRAFVTQLASAVSAVQTSTLGDDGIAARARHAGVGDRWTELLAFTDRYRARLRDRNAIDAGGAMRLATDLIASAALTDRFVEVVIDDAEAMSPAALRIAARVTADLAFTVAVDPDAPAGADTDVSSHLGGDLAVTSLPSRANAATERLVLCRHPSIEADAVVGELVAAHERGVAWERQAVIVPRHRMPIARAVIRVLVRREIPVRVTLADGDAEPIVRGMRHHLDELDPATKLRDALDDTIAAALRELASSPHADLVRPEPSLDRALDALAAFARAVNEWADAQAHPPTVGELVVALRTDDDVLAGFDGAGGADGGVAVVAVDDAAGRHWDFAVVSSCVEGEFPNVQATVGWFDSALAAEGAVPALAERRARVVADQRRRFGLAASRAAEVVFVAAPQPGMLVSRYVEHITPHEANPAWPASRPYDLRPATVTTAALHPTGHLRLSASQLSNYEDCPRHWFYENVLRLSDRTSVWADFGTLVHDVLEKFLDTKSTTEYSLDALLELSEQMWREDIAEFAPQRDQARRELRTVLENWWTMEGAELDRDAVVAVEHEFDVAVGDHSVRGRIDRVDRDPSRDGLSIIDYKTGRPKKEEEVVDDLQLAVYYLAALRSPDLAAEGPPSRLELLYVKANKRLEQPITEDHEERAEARILEAAAQMLEERLDPLPTANCDYCDYHRLCPLQRAGREVGAR